MEGNVPMDPNFWHGCCNLYGIFSWREQSSGTIFDTSRIRGIDTLQASIMACVIYVPGAAFASNSTVNALFSDFIAEKQPNEGFLMWSLVVVLITARKCREKGPHFYPHYYGIAAGLLCLFVVYEVLPNFVTVYKWANIVAILVATLIGALLSLVVVVPFARKRFDTTFKTIKKRNSLKPQGIESQDHQTCDTKEGEGEGEGEGEFEVAFKDFMQMRVLTRSTRRTRGAGLHRRRLPNSRSFRKIEKTSVKENALSFIRGFTKFTLFPVIEHDRHTLIRHALAEKFDEIEDFFEDFFVFPQLLASCIFALIQSVNEVAAIMSPFAAIADVFAYRAKYSGNGKDLGDVEVGWWFRAVGGLSASAGFFLCGWRLTHCLGGKLTYISNSRGMMSQLTTVATIIFVTRMKLPVSSVHAFVGSLVGVGIADDYRLVGISCFLVFF
ncbi:hypothetical protein Acr_06g0005890 [Actinidia rufa]|uniref:Phosphate transporter n=1 Tax=Actinidia rufa TaxID=165716 RepID=A0A7J0ERP1_9ERIC|nr:hypothetical protein Acr_06g0005890 [Actinidia rufa]